MRLVLVALAGAFTAACTAETHTVVVPPAGDACSAYGYAPGSEGHRICAEREAAARRRGRMAAGYAEAMIATDAQEACLAYGLVSGTEPYERCVRQEIGYRRPG